MVAQDQALSKNYFKKKFWKKKLKVISDYAKNEYIIRHDKICTYLHYTICKNLGIETAENWYSHIAKAYW